ncbi:MAG: glycoside hydrolase family 43 protein [Chitinophagaceae bacterium]
MKNYLAVILLFALSCTNTQEPVIDPKIPPMPNAAIWKDTEGNPINAHGGGLLLHNDTYYWFGEIKKGKTWLVPDQQWEDYRVPAGGVNCYSSKDLINWKYEGVALSSIIGDPAHDLDTSKVIERPKVVYNKQTKKFVMWMHVDVNDYSYSQAGVAISDNPTGPYNYIRSVKPNGQMSRDMTVYKDEDERAYLIYASESNKTMHVCLLADDYLSPTTTYTRITSADNREAPAVFKYNKKYYLITSDCTGWSPNPATYAIADSLLGSWQPMGNPCVGKAADSTFSSQSTFVLPIQGQKDKFLFMADRWNKTNLPDSRYIWLSLKMIADKPVIEWVD